MRGDFPEIDVLRSLKLEIFSDIRVNSKDGFAADPSPDIFDAPIDISSDNVEPPKAFDLALAYDSGSGNTTATCSNLYEISGLVQLYQSGTISVSLPDSDAYLGYEYTFATRIITLVTGAALANVSESSQPAATATSYKRALYYLIQSDDSWYIGVDLRAQPVNAIRM